MTTAKIVLAPNAFKECLTAKQVCTTLEAGIRAGLPAHCAPDVEVVHVPLADGGDGTMQLLVDHARTGDGEVRQVEVHGPRFERVKAQYGLMDGGRVCVVEMASASGLALLAEEDKDPLRTSTVGFGELIAHALETAPALRKLVLCIGGSATSDGGVGMATALGFRFLDADGNVMDKLVGGALREVRAIDASGVMARLREVQIEVACDVGNPLLGPDGAVEVYGPQKGATTPEARAVLEEGLANMAALWRRDLDVQENIATFPGAGAAGGLGAGLAAFCGATMKPGLQLVADAMGLKEAMQGADLVITGEGRIDDTTVEGKVPYGVAVEAKRQGVLAYAVAGSVAGSLDTLHESGLAAVFCIAPGPVTLQQSMERGAEFVRNTAKQLVRAWWPMHCAVRGE